ncbi:uncharacterized protein LOC100680496 isoform X2 [Nasonia vitripennis]|uniref:Uncharacterized protein n=1 Tax=Nasonia vitripennis TaxID=7425 RepID=A0A7M7LKP8_NASVI|nr:uncharacterized protein LOC100680496 isoform X2 [Nasonia vitripennis]
MDQPQQPKPKKITKRRISLHSRSELLIEDNDFSTNHQDHQDHQNQTQAVSHDGLRDEKTTPIVHKDIELPQKANLARPVDLLYPSFFKKMLSNIQFAHEFLGMSYYNEEENSVDLPDGQQQRRVVSQAQLENRILAYRLLQALQRSNRIIDTSAAVMPKRNFENHGIQRMRFPIFSEKKSNFPRHRAMASAKTLRERFGLGVTWPTSVVLNHCENQLILLLEDGNGDTDKQKEEAARTQRAAELSIKLHNRLP